jgi:hypothetical protein
MRVRFIRDWDFAHQKGSTAEVGPNGLGRGTFLTLMDRGLIEIIEEDGPPQYRTAVAVAPAKRGRGRPKGSKNKQKR